MNQVQRDEKNSWDLIANALPKLCGGGVRVWQVEVEEGFPTVLPVRDRSRMNASSLSYKK